MKHTALCGQQNILNETIYPMFCKASSEMRKSLLMLLRSCQCFVNISHIYDSTYGFDYNLQENWVIYCLGGDYFINCNFCWVLLLSIWDLLHLLPFIKVKVRHVVTAANLRLPRRINPACSWLGCQSQGPLRERPPSCCCVLWTGAWGR